jgi:hypothetical protein
MLREKALKAFGKPNLGSRRIFHNELFIIAQSDKERLEHKILPWEDTFSAFDMYLQNHSCFVVDSMVRKLVPCG